jgi:hypothetical protein
MPDWEKCAGNDEALSVTHHNEFVPQHSPQGIHSHTKNRTAACTRPSTHSHYTTPKCTMAKSCSSRGHRVGSGRRSPCSMRGPARRSRSWRAPRTRSTRRRARSSKLYRASVLVIVAGARHRECRARGTGGACALREARHSRRKCWRHIPNRTEYALHASPVILKDD